MKKSSRYVVASVLAAAAGLTPVSGSTAGKQAIQSLNARVVAINIPGASAIAQIGMFLTDTLIGGCPNPSPIPTNFLKDTLPGAVLDPNRILVGSQSNFGAPLAIDNVGQEGSFLSIDPTGPGILNVPSNFARNGVQASTLGGAVQMFSANSPPWTNSQNNPGAKTAKYTGVSNPLGLSNNNGFGRIWPANAPFGDTGDGSSSILDPTGLPLAGPPNKLIGGVYVGNLTDRDIVAVPAQPQLIPGALNTGAVGTALLGPSPDGTCKAVFAVVTADGAIVQEHTLKGLDGLAPAGTVQSMLGLRWDPPSADVDPRFGVIMNPYVPEGATVRQLFVSEPFNDTIAVINLAGTPPDQVFSLASVTRINSPALNLPVDLTPVKRDTGTANWASNTTLDDGSDFYVANREDNTIVRMSQNGTVVAVRRVAVPPGPLNNASLNGIATSTDGSKIYLTFTRPGHSAYQGGVLEVSAF
jgi:hypothetical protein